MSSRPRRFTRNFGTPGRRGSRSGSVSMNTNWEDEVIDQVVDYMDGQMADEVLRDMYAIVPVDTGELVSKTFVRTSKLGKRVASLEAGSTAPHFLFVEFGTGSRGRSSWRKGEGTAFPLPRGYVHGKVKGQKAQPFARPAVFRAMKKHFRMGTTR